jgi:dienelactone hydrolase
MRQGRAAVLVAAAVAMLGLATLSGCAELSAARAAGSRASSDSHADLVSPPSSIPSPGATAAPALPVIAGDVRIDGHPDGLVLTGVLYESSAVPRVQAPGIVMMHGCSGMLAANGKPTASNVFWGEHFARLGYRALLLDSFSARGVKEVCTQSKRPLSAAVDRPKDAIAALRWLQRDGRVDPARVFLIGWSNGAFATLHTVRAAVAARAGAPFFRAAVAMYPGCGGLVGRGYRSAVPLLIQSGSADDWTPSGPCERLAGEAAAGGAPIAIDVYTGAHHGFDRLDLPVRFRPKVRNVNSASGWGATVGTHPEARALAIVRVTEFIRAQDVSRETLAPAGR